MYDLFQMTENTGNPGIIVGRRGNDALPHFFVAQGDEIAGVVVKSGRSEVPITPDYAHRQTPKTEGVEEITSPGVALRYRESQDGKPQLYIVANGEIVTNQSNQVSFVTDHGPEDELRIGDRIVFSLEPRLRLTNGIYEGQTDDTLGDTIAFLSALTLGRLASEMPNKYGELEIYYIFDDREEGNPDGLFGGGAKNLAQANARDTRFANSTYTVCDGHDVLPIDGGKTVDDERLRSVDGALVAQTISSGKGITLHPDAQYRMEYLMRLAQQHGGKVYFGGEVDVLTSRSSENGLRYGGVKDHNVRDMGFGGVDYHFVQGRPPKASFESALEAARFATVMSVAANKGLL